MKAFRSGGLWSQRQRLQEDIPRGPISLNPSAERKRNKDEQKKYDLAIEASKLTSELKEKLDLARSELMNFVESKNANWRWYVRDATPRTKKEEVVS